MIAPQFQRIAERDRPVIRFVIDGRACEALAGDTLLTALLTNGRRLRSSEFGDGPRAGFCLMGACQDCWVALDDGTRLRACTSLVAEGMRIVTRSDVDTSVNDLLTDGRRASPRVPYERAGPSQARIAPSRTECAQRQGRPATDDRPPIVIGAGPAGVRAAATLAAAGLAPIVIDEAPASGGQIYRRAPAGFTRPYRTLYGFDAAKARRSHETFDGIRSSVDYRPDTLIWDLRHGVLHCVSGGRSEEVPYRDLILAPGARDRIIPFPGWTLPGIYTLGGAQIALKHQGCAIGRRIVFMGTGPLLYLVAYQYAKAGGGVAAVLDTTPFAAKRRAVPGLLRGGSTFAKGLWYVAALRARGIVMANGIRPLAAEEDDGAVSAFVYRNAGGRERRLACDAIAFGFGLSSETQLADLAEVPFAFDPVQQQFLPERDITGRTPVRGIYLAGDGGGIAGADAAELAGERAALALLQDRGHDVDRSRLAVLEGAVGRIAGFRVALEAAFPFPADLAAAMSDETILCRCEGVTAGAFRREARALDADEINRAKAFSRCGMGRCQGRVCGPAAAIVLAAALNGVPERMGRLRGQPPVKPIPMGVVVDD